MERLTLTTHDMRMSRAKIGHEGSQLSKLTAQVRHMCAFMHEYVCTHVPIPPATPARNLDVKSSEDTNRPSESKAGGISDGYWPRL